jgi:hypothetical protein
MREFASRTYCSCFRLKPEFGCLEWQRAEKASKAGKARTGVAIRRHVANRVDEIPK